MKRIDRQTLWYLIWGALTFPPKSHKKADLESSREFINGMCDRICNSIDSDRFAVIDGGDSFMGPRDPLPERGDYVELRTVRKGSPPPPVKPS